MMRHLLYKLVFTFLVINTITIQQTKADILFYYQTAILSAITHNNSTCTGSVDDYSSVGSNPAALVTPNGGENWVYGTEETIAWDNNALTGATVDMYILYDDPSNLTDYSSDLNQLLIDKNWSKFAETVSNTGAYPIDPAVLNGIGSAYVILIISSDGGWDISDGTFSLSSSGGGTIDTGDFSTVGSNPAALVTPNGGENWVYGTEETIAWDNNALTGATVDMYILYDDPSNLTDYSSDLNQLLIDKNWSKFAETVSNTGAYPIDPAVLNGIGSAYVILIVSSDGKWDISDGTFSLSQ